MAIKSNSYNFSNDLARIGSALSRAMIGNAQDDAAIARGNYYDAQTVGQNLQNRGMEGNLDAIDAASGGNVMRRSIANSLGYDVNNGNLIQPVLPGGPQRSVPAMGADQVNMDGGALMTELGNIARTLFGDGTSNASQVASALDTLGGAGTSRLAESMILSGDNNQAQRGALRLAPQGGQYQNPGFAMTQLRTQDATNRRDDNLQAETRSQKNVLESQDRRYATDASETTKRSKPIILGQNQVAFDAKGDRIGNAAGPTSPDKPIILKKGETAFDVDGTEIASVAGGPAIIKLTEGQVAMVEDPDAEGGYTEVRGSNDKQPKSIVASPGQTVVTIGNDGNVISTKTVDDDPITVKANEGQTVQLIVDDPQNPGEKKVIYTLEGQPKASSTTSTNKDTRKRPTVKESNQNWNNLTEKIDGYDDLPNIVKGKLRSQLFANVDQGMSQNTTASYDAVYAKAIVEVLSAGVTPIDTAVGDGISDFAFPTYFYQQLINRDEPFIRDVARDLGYSDKQTTAIINQILGE